MSELIERKAQDVCSGDVSVAAAYLDATGVKVWNGRYEEAKASLYYAENELQGIAYSRPYCANLAPLVKPYVAKVIRISADLDVLQKEYLKQKS